jgi:anti-sigma regulatory factor (Ser/Thr protein kinase)
MQARQDGNATGGGASGTLRLHVPADARYAKFVRSRVSGFACGHVVEDEDLREFLTAVGEALANAVEHSQSSGSIDITCWFDGDQLIARINDTGVGFAAPEDPRAGATLPHVYSEHGRGMAIMDRCTDIFAIQSAPGKGTTVILGRHLRERRRGHPYTNES